MHTGEVAHQAGAHLRLQLHEATRSKTQTAVINTLNLYIFIMT